MPRTQRSAPFFTAWCAAEPGPLRTPVLDTVPALRSSVKNAAARPGHRYAGSGGIGSAVTDLIFSMAKREVTFFRLTAPISFL